MSKKLRARFASDEAKEEEGVWADFGDGIRVKIRRFKSRLVQETQRKLHKPFADVVRRGPLPDHIAEDLMLKLMAQAVIADWEIPGDEEDDPPVPNTVEAKLQLLKELPEFRDEILSISFERDAYKVALDEEAEKNS